MKLSTRGRYGVRAMVDLAIHYGEMPVSIKSIAERQGISESYLEQLFSPLRKAKLIKSIRGAQGGYVLNREPKDITAADVMEVLEGPIEISTCVDEGVCSNSNYECCSTRLLWEKVKNSMEDIMKSVTLQDMAADYRRMIKDKE
ncbi:Rrf2 family transcriptional regulator [Clostridium sp. MB40-C1]|uniref:RrF2 family transcriptional regulator n=1 Tax=Clostridium sp. MB40-C1 TaxID=3070996 RepID=UPI0027E1D5FA|nr:Rrf2 family transcriptional regulator [Clostridium sp. MB40-C1]WMJ82143.1 Rrf2 family transcriptional regulator [Clostridium sp. MB40-C1]